MHEICNWPYPISVDEFLCKLMAKGDPIPAARARVTRFGTYTPARYLQYKHTLRLWLKESFRPLSSESFLHRLKPEDRRFGVRAFFYRRTFQRTDVDNLLKSVLDAGTSIVWPDDAHVLEVFGRVFRGSEDPRIEVLIYELEPEGAQTCEHCEILFLPPSRKQKSKFCSNQCRLSGLESSRKTSVCLHCGGSFTYPPSLARNRPLHYCSRACCLRALGSKKRENYSPKRCVDCGLRVSRPEYERCKGCRIAQRRGHASTFNLIKPTEVGQ